MSNVFTLKKLHKLVATISLVTLVASLFVVPVTAQAGNLAEVPEYARQFFANPDLVDQDKDFRPADPANKLEFSKLLTVAFGFEEEPTRAEQFTDVPEWAMGYVGAMVANNVASGRDSKTYGVENMTRAEQIKMIVSAMGLELCELDADAKSEFAGVEWAEGYFCAAMKEGIVTQYRPSDVSLRAEAVTLAGRAGDLGVEFELPGDEVETPQGGGLTVAVAEGSPKGKSFPSTASAVEVFRFELMAGSDGAVNVDDLTFKKEGLASFATNAQFYIFEGTERLAAGKTLNSDTETVSFRNLNLDVARNASRTLSLRADVGTVSASGDEFSFMLTEVESNAASVAGLPLSGYVNELSATAVGTITVEKTGSIENPSVGEQDAIIARFKLTAGTNDALLEQLGLFLSGTISTDDVQDMKLYVTGEEEALATCDGVSSQDVCTFVFDTPYEIEDGNTKTFFVRANLNTGRTDDTLKVFIDEKTDVVAIDAKRGYGMAVTINGTSGYDGTSCTSSSGKCSFSTLEGGDITISSNGPTATDIPTNGKDVRLMNFNITSVGEVTFKNFQIFLTASESSDTTEGLLNSSTANFTDIKVINTDTGATLMGPVDADAFFTTAAQATVISEGTGDNAKAYYKFTDEFEMEAGESLNLAITTDIANTSTLDGMTLVGGIAINNASSGFPEIRDVNNKVITIANEVVPAADITGKTMTVSSPSLTLSLASSPVSDTFVKGTQDVDFVGLTFRAGDSSDIKVTDVTLLGYLDDSGTADDWVVDGIGDDHATRLNEYVGSVELVDSEGTVIAGSQSVQADGTVVFNDVNWWVDAGATEIVYVRGDISADAFKNSNAENIAFGISSASNVVAEDADGSSVTPTGAPNSEGADATDPSVFMTTANGGSLTISVDPSTPKENILVAGVTNQVISKYRFESTNESFVVKQLSVNNRQSAVTSTSTLGDYDNNVTKVVLSYTNSVGETETKNAFLTSGTAVVSGLDFYVPKDDDAVLSIYADTQTIQAGAAAGEFVDLNIAFNNFEALGVGSGETYDASKLDANVAADSDLDFGSITFTDSGYDQDNDTDNDADVDADDDTTVDDVAASGNTEVLNIDTGSNIYPVGTLLFADADDGGCTYDSAADSLFVTTAVWSTTTPTVLVLNDADTSIADGVDFCHALPGTGYLTAAKQMHIYEALPKLTLNAGSPSGDRNVNSTDAAFKFDITETGGKEKIRIRTAKELTTCLAGNSTLTVESAAHTTAAEQVDGSGCNVDAIAGADDFVAFSAPLLEDYSYASFWIRWVDSQAADNSSFDVTELEIGCNTDNTGAVEHVTAVAASNIVGSPSTLLEGVWYHVTDVAMPSDCTTTDEFFNIQFAGADDSGPDHADDDVFLDRVVLYNDKLTIDLTSDSDFDADIDGDSAHEDEAPIVARLKEGSTTVATGYVDNASTDAAVTDSTTAVVHFYPIDGTDAAIEISKGTSKTYTVELSTLSLLDEDGGSDDPVTFSIDLGTSSDGTVTAGDFWWNETNASVQWLGEVANTTFTSNTVNY